MDRFKAMPYCTTVVRLTDFDLVGKVNFSEVIQWLEKQGLTENSNFDILTTSLGATNDFPVRQVVLAQNEDDSMQLWFLGPIDHMGNLNWFCQMSVNTGKKCPQWQEHVALQNHTAAMRYYQITSWLKTEENRRVASETDKNGATPTS